MRVIAGTRRSLPLKALEGISTRPTTDRIKETLFNMLNPYLEGAAFLDLFSGSGAIGIEALSRGAKSAVFVEMNRQAVKIIEDNVRFTKFTEESEIYSKDVISFLTGLKDPFDIIFMDPPYDKELEKSALMILARKEFITPETLIIIEASLKTDFSYLEELGFEILKDKKYKSNRHLWIRRSEES